MVEKGEVEAGVVGDEHGVAREVEEALHRRGGSRCAAQLRVPQAGQGCSSGRQRQPRIDERLELGVGLEATQANGADLADPGPAGSQPGGLEVDDDVRGLLEQERGAGRLGEPDRVAVPGEPGIRLDDVGEEGAREGDGSLAEREEPARCVRRVDRSPVLLHELHEAVGRV